MLDLIKQQRMMKISIALLVILNLALITSMIINKPPHMGAEVPQEVGLESFLRTELSLSDGQVEAFHNIRKEHFENLKPVLESLEDSLDMLVSGAFESEVDSVRINELIKNLAIIHSGMDKALYMHFGELNKICTPEQQARLKDLVGQLLQGSSQPPPPEGMDAGRRPPPDAQGMDRRQPPHGQGQPPGGPPPRGR